MWIQTMPGVYEGFQNLDAAMPRIREIARGAQKNAPHTATEVGAAFLVLLDDLYEDRSQADPEEA